MRYLIPPCDLKTLENLKPSSGLECVFVSTICAGVVAFACIEPFSAMWFGVPDSPIDYLGITMLKLFFAIVAVNFFGHPYHRYFQHLGPITRLIGFLFKVAAWLHRPRLAIVLWLPEKIFEYTAKMLQTIQRSHLLHHRKNYPIGPGFAHNGSYYCESVGLSWYLPVLAFVGVNLWALGIHYASVCFVVLTLLYAKTNMDWFHEQFHVNFHPWDNIKRPQWLDRYFEWACQYHLLHHWNEGWNFGIDSPWVDKLFGVAANPKDHQAELKVAREKHQFTTSDLINLSYLMIEASDAKVAEFISNMKNYSNTMMREKLARFVPMTKELAQSFPGLTNMPIIHRQSLEFLKVLAQEPKPQAWAHEILQMHGVVVA